MIDKDQAEARELLAAAQQAEDAGARAAARPAWYPPALGLSMGLALASFAVPWLTITGVVLGVVVLPLVIEAVARSRTGASPVSHLAPGARGQVVASVVVVVGVTAAALVHLKTTGAVWGVLVGAVVVGAVITWCTSLVSRRRSSGSAARPGGTR